MHNNPTILLENLTAITLLEAIDIEMEQACGDGETARADNWQLLANHRDDATYPDPLYHCTTKRSDDPDCEDFEEDVDYLRYLFTKNPDIYVLHIDGWTTYPDEYDPEEERTATYWQVDIYRDQDAFDNDKQR